MDKSFPSIIGKNIIIGMQFTPRKSKKWLEVVRQLCLWDVDVKIIPIQLLADDRLVKTTAFLAPRDVGDPVMSSKVYSDQDADELILLSIDRVNTSFDKLVMTVEEIS